MEESEQNFSLGGRCGMSGLSHYSNTVINEVYSVSQVKSKSMFMPKPIGLWISVDGDDDWPRWCDENDFGDQSLKYRHTVVLRPEAPIVRLATPQDILAFSAEFESRDYYLNWGRVADHFAGIIIAPYIWECRMDMPCEWYYTWDCASGCLWDATAVESIQLVSKEGLAACA